MKYNKLTPFKWCIINNFPFIEADFDAITNYQLFQKVVEYLNKTIDTTNLLGAEVENFSNYFNNLNVQDEINNKLDEMAIDGTLENIINQEIFGELNNKINNNTNNINKLVNKTNGLSLNMQNHTIHDIGNKGRIQGMCVDNENKMYVYNLTNNPFGDLLVYSLETNSLLYKIENLKLYHGNDMTFLNGKIYVATIYDENDNYTNKKICVYDLQTGELNEINPFQNVINHSCIWGISSYDENHLLCGLMYTGDNKWNNMGLFLLNINDLTYEEIQVTNLNNYYMDFYRYHQCMEYLNGKLYIALNAPNTLLELNVENKKANVEKFYNINNYDNLGLNLGEIEGISKIPSDLYGKGTLMFNTEININYLYNYKTLKTYLINPFSNMPLFYKSHWYEQFNTSNYRSFTYLDNTKNPNLLYEDGTPEYPFKDLGRALNFVNNSKICLANSIIAKGENYILGHQTRKNALISLASANDIFTIKGSSIFMIDCNIKFFNNFENVDNQANMLIDYSDDISGDDGYFDMEDCEITFYKTTIKGTTNPIRVKHSSVNRHFDTIIDNTSVNAILLDYCSQVYGGVKTFTNNNTYYYAVLGFSSLILSSTNNSDSKISKTATALILRPGTVN